MKRIGYQMENVEWYVKDNPGVTPMAMADWLTTRNGHKSRRNGYAIVYRAVAAGLARMVAREDKMNCYRLYPVGA